MADEMTQASVPRMSGTLVLAQRRALESVVGAAAVAAAIAQIDAELRDEYAAMMPVSWVRYTVPEAVLEAVARAHRRPMPALHEECARLAVDRTFKTLWRLALRVTSDAALVGRTPSIFSRTYDRGKMASRIVSPGHAEVVISELPGAPEFILRGSRVGIEHVLSLAGRKDVRVTSTRQRDGGTFHANWNL